MWSQQGKPKLNAFSSTLQAPADGGQTFPIPDNVFAETVTDVQHYTDRLFRFRTTRPASFRFRSGEFVMIGLPNAERPVFRAYSVASPAWDDELEFFSIKVPGGPLTEYLQKVKIGDTILMRKKPTGTLVIDALLPGKRLYMLSTGTGVAPFASLIRDPDVYEKFEEVILVQTCREVAELTYARELVDAVTNHEFLGELAAGKLFADLGVPAFDPATDRAMICGSMAMIKDTKDRLESFGLVEGANNAPNTFVVERAFVG